MAKTTAATRLTRAILYSLCMENEAEVLEYIRSKYRSDEVYPPIPRPTAGQFGVKES